MSESEQVATVEVRDKYTESRLLPHPRYCAHMSSSLLIAHHNHRFPSVCAFVWVTQCSRCLLHPVIQMLPVGYRTVQNEGNDVLEEGRHGFCHLTGVADETLDCELPLKYLIVVLRG